MKQRQEKSNGTKSHMLLLPFFLVAMIALIFTVPTASAGHGHEKVELDDATIIVEVNATDGDAGFQIFLDGEGWRRVSIYDPNWRQIFKVKTRGGIREIGGGTELFLETAEPEYEDLDELQGLLDLLSPGTYKFFGRTVDGKWLWGEAELTHVIPAGPAITAPVSNGDAATLEDEEDECAEVEADEAVIISWNPVTTDIFGSGDIEIVAYQVIVEDEEAGEEFSVTVLAQEDEAGNPVPQQVTVPEQLVKPDTEYKFEILAIEESGNQTITESCFETEEEEPEE